MIAQLHQSGQDAIRQIESTVVVGTDVVAPMSPDSKVNILLVDDQPARLLAYEAISQDLGQNLICARSGTEALE